MTQSLIANGQDRLYEAAFQFKGVMCAVDVLDNHKNKEIDIYEIKRNKKIKDVFLNDMALQYWVVSNAGYTIKKISLVQPSDEEYDDFVITDLTYKILELQNEVPKIVEKQFNLLIEKQIPHKKMGEHCYHPYQCSFLTFCKQQEVAD